MLLRPLRWPLIAVFQDKRQWGPFFPLRLFVSRADLALEAPGDDHHQEIARGVRRLCLRGQRRCQFQVLRQLPGFLPQLGFWTFLNALAQIIPKAHIIQHMENMRGPR